MFTANFRVRFGVIIQIFRLARKLDGNYKKRVNILEINYNSIIINLNVLINQ